MRNDILAKEYDIRKWIQNNQSKAFICRELSCKPETLNSYLKIMNIEYAGNKGGRGIKTSSKRMSALDYLKNSTCIKSHKLKKKLIEDGIKDHQCEECGLVKWNRESIPLELHHIDGNRYNNTIENISILCPNCHALCDNNSGKNIGAYK